MILVACVTGAALLGGGGYMALRQYRTRQIMEGKAKGLAAYQKGEWVEALHHLNPYLQHYPDDVEAIEAFVKVREKLVEPDGSHLYQAMRQYQRLVALKPEVLDYKRALNSLYAQLGMNTELSQGVDGVLQTVLAQLPADSAPGQDDADWRNRIVSLRNQGKSSATAPGRMLTDLDEVASATAASFKAALAARQKAGESPADIQSKYIKPLVETMKLEVEAEGRLRQWDEARKHAAILYAIAPGADTVEIDLTVRQMNQEPVDSLLQRLDKLTAGLSNDLETQIFIAKIYAQKQDDDSAKRSKAARDAAAACQPTSDKAVLALMGLMDSFAATSDDFGAADKVLDEGRAKFKSDLLDEAYWERLLYRQEYQTAAEELAKVDATKRPLVAGLRAMALCEWAAQLKAAGQADAATARTVEARQLLDVLQECGQRWDYQAIGWRSVLALKYFSDQPRNKELIEAARSAIDRDPQNAFFHEWLADAYQTSRDPASALPQWRAVQLLAPRWGEPLEQASRFFMARDNPERNPLRAYQLAQLAVQRMPEHKSAVAAYALAWGQLFGPKDCEDPKKLDPLLDYITKHSQQLATDGEVVPMEVAYLLQAKRPTDARTRVDKLLKDATATDAVVLLNTAQALSFAAQNERGAKDPDAKLAAAADELRGKCLVQYQALKGVTPDLAQVQAFFLLQKAADVQQTNSDAAAKLRQQARDDYQKEQADNAAKPDADVEGWDIGWCALVEATPDGTTAALTQARDAWQKAVQAHSKSLRVLWRAAGAPSVRRDHVFLGQILDWLEAQEGDTGLAWRLEKGQWLLDDQVNRDSRDALEQTTKFCNQTVILWPDSTPARQLLARAYVAMNNFSAAIQELSRAVEKDPANVEIRLDLATLYVQQKDKQVLALDQLKQVNTMKGVTSAQRTRAGVLATNAGDAALAAAFLEHTDNLDAKADLLIAYWQSGQRGKALDMLDDFLKEDPPPAVLERALWIFADARQPANAEKALKALDATSVERMVGKKNGQPVTDDDRRRASFVKHAVHGTYLAMLQKTDEAVAEYTAALQDEPKNARIWRWLIATQCDGRHDADALKSVAAASAVLANDPACQALLKLGASGLSDPDVRKYISTCILFPEQSGGIAEALLVIQAAKDGTIRTSATSAKMEDQLALVAGRNPDCTALQVLVIRKFMAASRIDDALATARRTLLINPSAEPAQLAAMCLAQQAKWDELLNISNTWLSLAPNSPDAMLVHASALVNLNRRDDAAEYLSKLDVKEISAIAPTIHQLQAQIYLQQGKVAAAENLMWPEGLDPAVTRDAVWRANWARLAVEEMPADHLSDAERWIRKLAATIPADDIAGQVFIAGAWTRLALLRNDQDARLAAMDAAQKAAAITQGDPMVRAQGLTALGMLREDILDNAMAEDLYRRALTLNPTFATAMNNLAIVLAKNPVYGADGKPDPATQKRLDEALQLSQRAIAGKPDTATFYDTQATVYTAMKRHADALNALSKAVEKEPRNPEWLLSTAETQLAAGQMNDARDTLKKIEGMDANFILVTDPKKKSDPDFAALKKRYDKLKEAMQPK